jgi:hypothetical protein
MRHSIDESTTYAIPHVEAVHGCCNSSWHTSSCMCAFKVFVGQRILYARMLMQGIKYAMKRKRIQRVVGACAPAMAGLRGGLAAQGFHQRRLYSCPVPVTCTPTQ